MKKYLPWIIALAWVIVLTTGICIAAKNEPSGGNGHWAAIGFELIAFDVLSALITALVLIIRGVSRQNQRWLSQFSPGQRHQIQQAQRAALWGAAAVGVYATQQHMRHSTNDSWAASQAASRQRQAAFDAQQQHEELLSAIQGGQGGAPYPGALERNANSRTHQLMRGEY